MAELEKDRDDLNLMHEENTVNDDNPVNGLEKSNEGYGVTTNSVPEIEIDVDVSNIYDSTPNDDGLDSEGNKNINPCISLEEAKTIVAEYKRKLGYPESKSKCPVCKKKFKTMKQMHIHKAEAHGRRIYHCVKCDKWYPTSQKFDDHLRADLNIRPYKCDKCTKCFTAKKYLHHHSMTHFIDTVKPFSCSYCTKRFIRKKHAESHERMHTNERPYECSDCGKTYKHAEQMLIHRRLHTGERFYCQYCNRGFTAKCELEKHERVHTGAKPYSCDTCGSCFRQLGTLKSHIRTHDEHSNLRKEKCGICKRFFHSKYLKAHIKLHEPNRRSTLTCKYCKDLFAGKNSLYNHIRYACKRREYPEWRCDSCGKCVKSKASLIKHKKFHTDGFKYPCKQCDKAFPMLNVLNRHMKLTHLRVGKKGTKCKLCNARIVDMKSHLVKRHPVGEIHRCATCGQTYKNKASLEIHENTHMESRPYKCDTCQYKFAQKGALNIHIKRRHVDLPKPQTPVVTEKGTKCKLCYNRYLDIDAHMKTHERKAPIECFVCKKVFTNKRALKDHEATHLKVKPWRCDTCQRTFSQKHALKLHIIKWHIPVPRETTAPFIR